MTEDEAKTKWCPMVRTAYRDYINVGESPELGLCTVNDKESEASRCIASKCMMWRESSPLGSMATGPHGYCGLAQHY